MGPLADSIVDIWTVHYRGAMEDISVILTGRIWCGEPNHIV